MTSDFIENLLECINVTIVHIEKIWFKKKKAFLTRFVQAVAAKRSFSLFEQNIFNVYYGDISAF